MRAYVDLKIFRPTETFIAQMALMWFLFCVGSNVNQHFVAGIETPLSAMAARPTAIVETVCQRGNRVYLRNMYGQKFQTFKASGKNKQEKLLICV